MLRASFVKRVLPVLAALALLGCEAEMITDGSGGDAARDLSLLIVSGDNQTGPAGMELPLPLVVKATGPTGLPLKGQVVNFVVTAGGGRVFAGAAVTNAQGIAREYWTLGTVAGAPQALEVRAVNPGNGVKLVFGTFTATAVPVPLTSLRLIYAEDDNNNLSIYSSVGDGSGRQFLNVGTGPTQVGNLVLARGAFQDDRIYAMDALGQNRHQIVGPGPSYAPDLSPDGSRFVFLYGDCPGGHPIATANADGSGLVVLPICTSGTPRWSPLGDRIAYTAGSALYTARTDGSGIQLVINLTADLAGPTWSAQGTSLAFSWKSDPAGNYGIYTVNTDGTNLRQVTSVAADDFVQDWSPAGDWLVFFSTRSGSLALWVVQSDGSGMLQIPTSSARPDAVRWQR